MQYVVGGADRSTSILSTMEVYDLQTGKWAAAPPMSTKRYGCGVAEMDGLLYVVGGVETIGSYVVGGGDTLNSQVNTAERFSPASNNWEPLPPMATKRWACAAAVLGGSLYVAGGFNGSAYVDTVECFSPASNTWTTLPPMSTKRLGCAAAECSLSKDDAKLGRSFHNTAH